MKIQDLFERTSFNNFDDVVKYAINSSRPALSQMSVPLYRGMSNVDNHDKIISKGDRFSTNDDMFHMSPVGRKAFDQWMIKHFNYPYLSKGIFTTASKRHASEYGELFLVLPIGQFQYVWSPTVGDCIDVMTMASQQFGKDYTTEQFTQIMDQSQYTNKNLQQAMSTDHEIILNCDRFFHFSNANLKDWNSGYRSIEELFYDLKG